MERREERLGQSWRGQGGSLVAQEPCPGSSGGGLLEAGGRGRKLPRERMGTVSLTKASMASVATSKTGLGLVAASCLRSTEVAHQLTSLPSATCYRSHLLSSTQPLLTLTTTTSGRRKQTEKINGMVGKQQQSWAGR